MSGQAQAMKSDIILEVDGLRTYIQTERGMVRCVDGADLRLRRGETLGLVGESGCGKTMMARSIMGLVDDAPGVIDGSIQFCADDGQQFDLTQGLGEGCGFRSGSNSHFEIDKDMRRWKRGVLELYRPLWGRHLSIIFQDPQTSLNPYWSVGEQLREAITIGRRPDELDDDEIHRESLDWMDRVHISFPERVLGNFAHELSGGMCQRIMIAIALASRPDLVIADEPTTGLDVTIQARIVELFKELRQELGLTVLLISHDMGLIGQLADRVAVMYCGRVVECGSRDEVLRELDHRHPYTEALLGSMPTLTTLKRGERLPTIRDSVPDPLQPPRGCAFHPRCGVWEDEGENAGPCDQQQPPTTALGVDHWVKCWKRDGEGA